MASAKLGSTNAASSAFSCFTVSAMSCLLLCPRLCRLVVGIPDVGHVGIECFIERFHCLLARTGNELQPVLGVHGEALLQLQPRAAIRVVYLGLFQNGHQIIFRRRGTTV